MIWLFTSCPLIIKLKVLSCVIWSVAETPVSDKSDKVSSPAFGAVVSTTTFCIVVSDAFPARSVTTAL
ncbi:hypothetical protein D3C81_687310 [compost metagenome]